MESQLGFIPDATLPMPGFTMLCIATCGHDKSHALESPWANRMWGKGAT